MYFKRILANVWGKLAFIEREDGLRVKLPTNTYTIDKHNLQV